MGLDLVLEHQQFFLVSDIFVFMPSLKLGETEVPHSRPGKFGENGSFCLDIEKSGNFMVMVDR